MNRHFFKKILLKSWHKKCIFNLCTKSLWTIVFISLLLLNGCKAYRMPKAPVDDEAAVQITPLTFVSGTLNGSWVRIAAAIAEKTNAFFNGYPITVTTGGSIANPYLIQRGQADIGLSQSFFLNKDLEGETPFKEPLDNLRGIGSLETRALYFIADHDLEVRSLGEAISRLNNMQLGTLPQTDTSQMIMNAVFAEYGLADAKEIQASGSDVYLAEGSALFKAYLDSYFDCLVLHEALNDAAIAELMNKRTSVILSLEPEVIDSLNKKYGWLPLTIPAGTYPGQTEDVHTVGIRTVLVVRKDIPSEAAYYLTKAIYENKAYFETIQDSYKNFNVSNMLKDLTVPVHPGAEQFYKEVGLINDREVLR